VAAADDVADRNDDPSVGETEGVEPVTADQRFGLARFVERIEA